MSKYIKYISSDHYGAPVMKGDRWGYCVEMLRKCLVEGFNKRTDLKRVEVISEFVVKYTFATPHNYVAMQTITVSGLIYPELNTEAFITSSDTLSITCKLYNSVAGLVGQSVDNMSATSIVAPLGFKEKFKDGNRSVFVTDEDTENAYFYIDDRQPTNNLSDWKESSTGNTRLICPLVFMTDKMTDIDTVTGKYIFPYDSANPLDYKTANYKYGGNPANGILTFITFGVAMSGSYYNAPSDQQVPIKYTVIGNGRMFYFIPQVVNYGGSGGYRKDFIYAFGKTGLTNSNLLTPYVLIANANNMRDSMGCYTNYNIYYGNSVLPISNFGSINSVRTFDCGNTQWGILNCNGKSQALNFYPSVVNPNGASYVNISGNAGLSYPDSITKKFYMTPIKMVGTNSNVGNLSGLMWTHSTNAIFMQNRTVNKYTYKNNVKYVYFYQGSMGTNINGAIGGAGAYNTFIYGLSLDYSDWGNYE